MRMMKMKRESRLAPPRGRRPVAPRGAATSRRPGRGPTRPTATHTAIMTIINREGDPGIDRHRILTDHWIWAAVARAARGRRDVAGVVGPRGVPCRRRVLAVATAAASIAPASRAVSGRPTKEHHTGTLILMPMMVGSGSAAWPRWAGSSIRPRRRNKQLE